MSSSSVIGGNGQNVRDLFSSAVSSQDLDDSTALILVDNLDALALAGCGGTDVDMLNTDDVTLVALVLDESGSMAHLRQDVIDGYNTLLDTFQGSKQADSILLSTWSFSDKVKLHFSYTPVAMLKPLGLTDYAPDGGTALYDAALNVMTGLVGYGQLLRDSGVRTRCIVVVFSDGDDNSSQANSQQVRSVSAGLLAQEIYTLAYAGFGKTKDLQRIADAVGFPAIITANNSASEIRRIFKQVSASVIKVSQNRVGGGNSFFTP